MTHLYYVGFNGYQQCPNDGKTISPKVFHKWKEFSMTAVSDIECTFRNVVVKTESSFIIYGLASDCDDTKYRKVDFPVYPKAFLATDDILFVSDSNNLWKSQFDDKWTQIKFSHTNEEELTLWTNQEILKLCFLRNKPHVIILSDDGTVWRMNSDNKLSIVMAPNLDKAIDISCGFEHCLILTAGGCVFTFGNSSRGQLGHGELEPVPEPMQVMALGGLKIVKIAAGGWHSSAITDCGDLFLWGWNNFGQLTEIKDDGTTPPSDRYELSSVPMLVEIADNKEANITDVACGVRHTVIITENNEVYSTGWNEYGQLGIDDKIYKRLNKFTRVKLPADKKTKKHLRCGPWSTLVYERIETKNEE